MNVTIKKPKVLKKGSSERREVFSIFIPEPEAPFRSMIESRAGTIAASSITNIV
jgi:hypothetical protein